MPALREPQPVTTGKIGLEYDHRFWETDDRIFGGITHGDPSVRDIWYPSTGYLGQGGVLVGAYPFGRDADRFSRLPHEGRQELAVSVGEAIHGALRYRQQLRSSFSVDWATHEHSRAAWCGWRQFGVAYDRLLRGDGRWWFAGDWLARTPGWQHGSASSPPAEPSPTSTDTPSGRDDAHTAQPGRRFRQLLAEQAPDRLALWAGSLPAPGREHTPNGRQRRPAGTKP